MMTPRQKWPIRLSKSSVHGLPRFSQDGGQLKHELSALRSELAAVKEELRAAQEKLALDRTPRKEYSERLLRSHETFQQLFSGNPFGVYLVDAEFLMKYVSRGAYKVFSGLDPLVGRDFEDIMRTIWPVEFAEEVLRRFRHTLVTGESYTAHNTVQGRADITAMQAYDWTIERIVLPDGGPGVVCYFYDISERVAHEQAANESSRRMQMALRAGGMAAWEWTPQCSYWSKELHELLGVSCEEVPSPDRFFESVHPDDLADVRRAWQAAIAGTESYNCEFRIYRPDGQVRWLGMVGEVIRDLEGQATRIYGLNWDSTLDHQRAQALQDSQRRALQASASKSEFLANMSHEIRTPMTAILGYAELLSDYVEHEEARNYLQIIQQNGAFLLDIINDILDLSKIEAGKLEIVPERFAPHRVFEDVHSIMDVRASQSNLKLHIEYATPIPSVIESDGKRLKQILINLVGNAIKFTKRGNVKLIVGYQEDQSMLQVDVYDTGIGMSHEQQESLFQPFSQGDALVTRDFGGTGLGLAISQRLAAMLGGEIRCQSELGRGSHFTLTLATGCSVGIPLIAPLSLAFVPKQSTKTVGVRMEEPLASATRGALDGRILIVDDRRDIRFLSNRILTKAGALVSEAEDGLIALQKVQQATALGQAPDLILLDMQMPNLDGYETAKHLRDRGYLGPIIALTADAMQGDMNRCLESGCNDYLSKPIDSHKLLDLVARFLQRE
jgi:two-component system CheB/CheR fusion protein